MIVFVRFSQVRYAGQDNHESATRGGTILNHLITLEDAITDVGYWRWWIADLPSAFQLEFGGTQLWNPPAAKGEPPSGVIALRFDLPTLAVFLTARARKAAAPLDWPTALQQETIDCLGLAPGDLTLTSTERFADLVRDMEVQQCLTGSFPPSPTQLQSSAFLALRSGDLGVAVIAAGMSVRNRSGTLSPDRILEANRRWWEYWREYWQRKDGPDPMPVDYGCEVTIPIKGG